MGDETGYVTQRGINDDADATNYIFQDGIQKTRHRGGDTDE